MKSLLPSLGMRLTRMNYTSLQDATKVGGIKARWVSDAEMYYFHDEGLVALITIRSMLYQD